jgi:hypothetical protein
VRCAGELAATRARCKSHDEQTARVDDPLPAADFDVAGLASARRYGAGRAVLAKSLRSSDWAERSSATFRLIADHDVGSGRATTQIGAAKTRATKPNPAARRRRVSNRRPLRITVAAETRIGSRRVSPLRGFTKQFVRSIVDRADRAIPARHARFLGGGIYGQPTRG